MQVIEEILKRKRDESHKNLYLFRFLNRFDKNAFGTSSLKCVIKVNINCWQSTLQRRTTIRISCERAVGL